MRGKFNQELGKLFLFFVLVFSLSYFDEAAFVGGLKFGVVWKALFLILLAVRLLASPRVWISYPSLFGSAYGLKGIVYVYSSIEYFVLDLAFAIKFLIAPLLAEWMRTVFKDPSLLRAWCDRLALVLAFSVVPFLFGLKPIVEADTHSLSIYGLEGEFEFSGIFGNKHNAAVSLACSFLVLFDSLHGRVRGFLRVIYIAAAAISLYGLYVTYARTGMFCLVVGVFVYYVYSASLVGAIKRFSLAFFAILPLILTAFASSEVFRMRMLGTNLYQDDESFSQLGSGRFDFWFAALTNWTSGESGSFFIGLGLERARDLMLEKVGLRIFAHNGFIDALQVSGIVGFVLYLAYIFFLGRALAIRSSSFRPLSMSLFYGWIAVQLVQGGVIFWQSVFLALVLALSLVIRRDDLNV